jgi:hypothetical protein
MALTLRTRRKIFYTLVALFILVGGSAVFYAQGWRLDFATWHFEKIGGIYVRAYPENASIYLDGQPIQNQSGFLSPGTVISDLLPRTYSILLKAAGYDDWQENATVEPSLITQYKYAVLVPADAVPASSSAVAAATADQAAANTASTTDPYDTDLKIIFTKNRIETFDEMQATTTASTTITGKNISLTWASGAVAVVLQNDGQLYLYDANAGTLQKLADTVEQYAVTDDGSMIAALENASLEIFSRTDAAAYYRFNLPDIADATNVVWYRDRTHLFIVYPAYVAFLDLADSGLTNFTVVAHGSNPLYDPTANALYIKTSLNQYMRYNFPD